MTDSSAAAEGWYRDPYGIHQDRWFSAGTPTPLVRDGDTEDHDPPPGYPPPQPPVEIPDTSRFPADDLRRADEAEATAGHSNRFPNDDLRRADEAEANPAQGDEQAAFDRVLNPDATGFADGEPG